MLLKSFIHKLIHIGTSEEQTIEASNRLQIVNKFNLMCISYSVPYVIFSVIMGYLGPAIVFFVGMLFYTYSLYLNSKRSFNAARYLILIATNFSVYYLSLYYGMSSGFHLYFFTSPLIVFSIFNYSESRSIVVGIGLYTISLALLEVTNLKWAVKSPLMSSELSSVLYNINTFLAMSFTLMMATQFSFFNKKTNTILELKNEELEKKQLLLEGEIVERKNTEQKLQTSLKEKEMLMSETHHRVKNNLAVVSGMLDLQYLVASDEEVRNILKDSRSRIKSMSLIHESLYKNDNLSEIEFSKYICILAEDIRYMFTQSNLEVETKFAIEKVYLDVTKAIPCGLLVNEVLTNSYKHAFRGRANGEISITLKQTDNQCHLTIKDNGVGMNVIPDNGREAIGMTLIDAFVKQLNGKHEFVNDNGTKLNLTFER